jgi:hypothetical protein
LELLPLSAAIEGLHIARVNPARTPL